MQKLSSDVPFRYGQLGKFANGLRRRKSGLISMLSLLAVGLVLAGCGGGSDGSSSNPGVSSQVVRGVASAGGPVAGQVTVKDASNPSNQRTAEIGNDGSFAVDVTGMKGPLVLEAAGSVGGVNQKLFSFAKGPGRVNLNPLSNAAMASAAKVDDPEEVYRNPNRGTVDDIKSGLPEAIDDLHEKLRPALSKCGAERIDPLEDDYKTDHSGLDGFFEDAKFTLADGLLTITNKKTGGVIFSASINDITAGRFTDDDDDLPCSGPLPVAPTGLTATGGDLQVTISWNAVAGATSYNLYWSTTPGVTTTNGTKAAGATSPTVQTGLDAATTYYYIVTAVNGAGEGPASAEVSATTDATPSTTPTAPAAPAGVTATGGTNQVTISWPAVTGATSYNIYWSTTTGVTTSNGTKIAGATSPTVQTGLTAATAYYYILTTVNSAGESGASAQVAATTLPDNPAPTPPAAPTGVTATGGTNQVTVSWSAVTGADSYNLYWSTASGVTTATGTKIAGVTSPYVQTGLAAGTAYFYVITAVNGVGESLASAQVTATTAAAPPPGVSYSATIQPILTASCTGCHGSSAGVTLSSYAATIKTVTPGNAAGSLLYQSLNGTGVTKMPPGGSLTAAQIQAIADWINQGALNN